jgi:hypothetical protein
VGQAIGGSLPLAIGVALSPVPIIAVVLMLTSGRAKVNGPAFVLGWLAGLIVVGAIVLSVCGGAGASSSGGPATWVSWVKLVLGVLLLAVSARQFRGRPRGGATAGDRAGDRAGATAGNRGGDSAGLPGWMGKIETIRPAGAAGLAMVLAGVNPKNLLLAVGGAAAIAQTGISGGEQAIAYLVFALAGTLGVGIPVGIYLAMGERATRLLAGLKDWMGRNNAVIMSVLCLIIGVKLIGDAISGLAS